MCQRPKLKSIYQRTHTRLILKVWELFAIVVGVSLVAFVATAEAVRYGFHPPMILAIVSWLAPVALLILVTLLVVRPGTLKRDIRII